MSTRLPVSDVRKAIRDLKRAVAVLEHLQRTLDSEELTEQDRNQTLRDILALERHVAQLIKKTRSTHDRAAGGRLTPRPRGFHPFEGWTETEERRVHDHLVGEINALVERIELNQGLYVRMAASRERTALRHTLFAEYRELRRLERNYRGLWPHAPPAQFI